MEETTSTATVKKASGRSLTVHVTADLIALLDEVTAAYKPWCRRHQVHLAALSIGLAAMKADPELLVRWKMETGR